MSMKVREVMTAAVRACRPDEPMAAAAKLMWEHDVGALPVVDGQGKVLGIVTDRDLCMGAFFTGEPLSVVPVEHAMSRVVFTIEPSQRLEDAEQIMRSNRLRRLPVVEGGKLVGMITLGDLARAAQARKAVTAAEVNAVLAAVVEPRRGGARA